MHSLAAAETVDADDILQLLRRISKNSKLEQHVRSLAPA